jgi:molybdenum cofactor cytidylyltransferase
LSASSGKKRLRKRTTVNRSARRPSNQGPSVVILAAGASTRFPGTKQLAKIGGKALIERVLDAIPSALVSETVVVLGHEAEAVAEAVAEAMRGKKTVRVVVNEEYEGGMSTSIRAGISALAKGTDGALLLLADQPFVTRSLLRRMLRIFEAGGPRSEIVAAAHANIVTPPVVFSRRYFRELEGLEGDQGARAVIERHSGSVSLVRVRSTVALSDVDTREDFEAARRLLES